MVIQVASLPEESEWKSMDVNPTSKTPSVASPALKSPVRTPEGPRDQVHFDRVDTLNRQLSETPEVRSALVEEARKLVSLAGYPPPEALDRIAHLLAMNLASGPDTAGAESAYDS